MHTCINPQSEEAATGDVDMVSEEISEEEDWEVQKQKLAKKVKEDELSILKTLACRRQY
jgi:hypothetical protein